MGEGVCPYCGNPEFTFEKIGIWIVVVYCTKCKKVISAISSRGARDGGE